MSRVRLDVTGLLQIKKRVPAEFAKIFTATVMLEVAEFARAQIYNRTKSGLGLSSDIRGIGGASEVKMKPLSEKYVKWRRKQRLGKFGSAGRSNLTLTGELLESMIVKTRPGGGAIVEIPDTERTDGSTNAEVAAEVAEFGRPFFGLSDKQEKILENFVNRMIRNKLRELNR